MIGNYNLSKHYNLRKYETLDCNITWGMRHRLKKFGGKETTNITFFILFQSINLLSVVPSGFLSDCSNSVGVAPYIICGVVLVLYVLTVIVDVYKYQK